MFLVFYFSLHRLYEILTIKEEKTLLENQYFSKWDIKILTYLLFLNVVFQRPLNFKLSLYFHKPLILLYQTEFYLIPSSYPWLHPKSFI